MLFRSTGFNISPNLAMPAATGTFTLTGISDSFNVALPAGYGLFTLTGVSLNYLLALPAATGSFSLGGEVLDFVHYRKKLRSFRRVGQNTISSRSSGRGMKARVSGG